MKKYDVTLLLQGGEPALAWAEEKLRHLDCTLVVQSGRLFVRLTLESESYQEALAAAKYDVTKGGCVVMAEAFTIKYERPAVRIDAPQDMKMGSEMRAMLEKAKVGTILDACKDVDYTWPGGHALQEATVALDTKQFASIELNGKVTYSPPEETNGE